MRSIKMMKKIYDDVETIKGHKYNGRVNALREIVYNDKFSDVQVETAIKRCLADVPEKAITTDSEDSEGIPWSESDEMIKVVHGGGYNFINDFINGNNKGYRLERGGKGLQVHPIRDVHESIAARVSMYANRGATYNFDVPAVLTAMVKASDLEKSNNDYEAGIIDHASLIDVKIEILELNENQMPCFDADLVSELTQ